MGDSARKIVDIDTMPSIASVEQRDNSRLQGITSAVVCWREREIVAASHKAGRFGDGSATPSTTAAP